MGTFSRLAFRLFTFVWFCWQAREWRRTRTASSGAGACLTPLTGSGWLTACLPYSGMTPWPSPPASMRARWPTRMRLSHQFPGEPSLPSRARQAGAHFVWLSENVALGPSTSIIHAAVCEVAQAPRQHSGYRHECDGHRNRRAQRSVVCRGRLLQSQALRISERGSGARREHLRGFPPAFQGQGAPAACHCFTLTANSSCGMGTGVLPSPGFQAHLTSLSSVRCSTSWSRFRFLFCFGSLMDWQIWASVRPCQTMGVLAGGKPQLGAPGGRCAPARLWS